VNLGVDLRIDAGYVPDMNQRLMLYRRIAAARRDPDIDKVLDEAADRYGPPPDSVLNLADYGRIRVMADRIGIESIDREARTVVLKFRPQAKVDPVRLVALVRQRGDLTLVPPAALRLALDGAATSAIPRPLTGGVSAKKGGGRHGTASWWTARARAGEVTPGFSKAEILRPKQDDPRQPGGILERVGDVLSELLDRM